MHYIIDGHNLIPKIPGLKLSDPEDEKKLIDLLIPFLRLTRSRARVFFDRAADGQSGERNFGLLKAVFVPAGQSADSAIIAHIHKLAGEARNHSLVSSDRMIQAAARARYVPIIRSEDFADMLIEKLEEDPERTQAFEGLTVGEVEEWEALFNQYGTTPDGYNP